MKAKPYFSTPNNASISRKNRNDSSNDHRKSIGENENTTKKDVTTLGFKNSIHSIKQ